MDNSSPDLQLQSQANQARDALTPDRDIEMALDQETDRIDQRDAMMRDDTSDQKSKFQFNVRDRTDMPKAQEGPFGETKDGEPQIDQAIDQMRGKYSFYKTFIYAALHS